jgi:hypothetical protein
LKWAQASWGPIYEAVLNLLGSTGTILPLGDPHHGQPDATTFKTVGGEQVTFTWSEAWNAFDGHNALADSDTFPYRFQGIIPFVDFNGTDEEADTPDITYWSRGDGSNDSAFSMGFWVKPASISGNPMLFTKGVVDDTEEWSVWLINSGKFNVLFRDQSVPQDVNRPGATNVVNEVWQHLLVTYDGAGGASAMDTVNMYYNGVLDNGTANNNANYVAMENLAGTVNIARRSDGNFYTGKMAGGPLGPCFTQKELSADEVLRYYHATRGALGV